MNATVRDVMTANVVAVREAADYKEIVTALRRFRVSACPVIDDDGRVLGVVSEADLLAKLTDPELPAGLIRLSWRLGEQTKATAVTAARLMTAPAVCVRPDQGLRHAAKLMQDRQVKRLPVVDSEQRLVGIVSRCDVLSVFDQADGDVAKEVAKVIADDTALDAAEISVAVASGIATLTGAVQDRVTALGLLSRVRHADGVIAVRDRLSYPRAGQRPGR